MCIFIFFQQFDKDPVGFVEELQNIWNVLYPSALFDNNFITQVFQVLPTVYLPKVGYYFFKLKH